MLRDNIRRYGSKIKRDDDDNSILSKYSGYYINNELYMMDVYNEIGLNYKKNDSIIKNITDVYIKIYFPKIWTEDVSHIISYLNGNVKAEKYKMENMYFTLNNDLIMENEIMKTVDSVRDNEKYKQLFKGNYITQSVIHLRITVLHKLMMH